jgi:F0F1-type ATP synthase assembly protein I
MLAVRILEARIFEAGSSILGTGAMSKVGRFARRYRVKSFAQGYQAGIEAVFALAMSAGVGAWADSHYDTGPVFLLVGMAVGFGACILRLLRYQRAQAEEAAREKESDDAS